MSISKTPLKRSKELQSFSREHHHGLLLCSKIGKGIRKGIETDRIWNYVAHFYQNSLIAHFEDEEKYVFPVLGNDHELVKKALSEHRRLHRLFADKTQMARSISLIEEELEAHIRFEERVLFPEIQKIATEEQLQTIEEYHTEIEACVDWKDEFWK